MMHVVAGSKWWCVALVAIAVVGCGGDKVTKFGGQGGDGGGLSAGGQGGDGASAGGAGGSGGIGGAGGVGGEPWPQAPALRNPVMMSDSDLAYESLILMGHEPIGATTTRCSECHQINQGTLGLWKTLTETAVASCFADPTVPSKLAAEDVLTCLKQKPSVPNSPFYTQKLGIYSAAAHLDWFKFVIDGVHGEDGAAERDAFLQVVAMPKESQTPLTQAEFDIIAEWFARGLPFMAELLPDMPPPGGCIADIAPEVATHVNDMELNGWRAVNLNDGLLMFGCAGAPTTLDCLAGYPQASNTAFGVGWEHLAGAKLRILQSINYSSSFWTRSSADGRYVAHGGSPNGDSAIVDLANNSVIEVNAAYDPGFFPDNSAFIFQGTPTGTGICFQSLLSNPPAVINFNEPQCSGSAQVGLYQHVGAALGGGDYWAVDGPFVSDDGGHFGTFSNPDAFFGGGSDIDLTPMLYNGSSFVPKATHSESTPNEGDVVMSKSSLLLMGRVAGAGFQQNGFRLRKLTAIPNGGSYNVSTTEIGRYCINGGKPGISFDERWAVLHQYVTSDNAVELGFSGPNDPGFQPYLNQGAANIYLVDLLSGLALRVTHMSPGQYALFPHFRSDGWIYFIVRTSFSNQEHIVASDAALTLEE